MMRSHALLVFPQVLLAMALAVQVNSDNGTYDITVQNLYQNDPQWKDEKMDNSSLTIGAQGCTLTAWTMQINRAILDAGLHEKKSDGTIGPPISYTPAELNTMLNSYRNQRTVYKKVPDEETKRWKWVMDEEGKRVVDRVERWNGWGVPVDEQDKPTRATRCLSMGTLLKAVEKDTQARSFEGKGLTQVRYRTPGFGSIPAMPASGNGVLLDNNYTYILDELAAGRPVVVRTRNNQHSVLVKSFHQESGKARGLGRYDIADPDKQGDTSIEWLDDSSYGNRIWNWDCGVFQPGGVRVPYEVPSPYWIDPEYLYDPVMNPDAYGPQVCLLGDTPEPAAAFLLLLSAPLAVRLRRRGKSPRTRG